MKVRNDAPGGMQLHDQRKKVEGGDDLRINVPGGGAVTELTDAQFALFERTLRMNPDIVVLEELNEPAPTEETGSDDSSEGTKTVKGKKLKPINE